jgi:hypothetical protein
MFEQRSEDASAESTTPQTRKQVVREKKILERVGINTIPSLGSRGEMQVYRKSCQLLDVLSVSGKTSIEHYFEGSKSAPVPESFGRFLSALWSCTDSKILCSRRGGALERQPCDSIGVVCLSFRRICRRQ